MHQFSQYLVSGSGSTWSSPLSLKTPHFFSLLLNIWDIYSMRHPLALKESAGLCKAEHLLLQVGDLRE